MRDPNLPDGTLCIGMWNTTCNNCGRGATPSQDTHNRVYSYSSKELDEGCGVTFTHVYSPYGFDDEVKAMRPDLELVT